MVKFLIIRLNSFCDILFSTPLIRGLAEQVEESEIHFLAQDEFMPMLEVNPHISKVQSFNNNYHKLISSLKNEEYDYVIDLQKNMDSLRMKNALHRFSFSVKSQKFREWLFVQFKINRFFRGHIVNRYLSTANAFSVEDDGKGLDFFIPESDEVNLEELLLGISKKFLAVIVGGGQFTSQIPIEKLAGVLDQIQTDVVLLGEKGIHTNTFKLAEDISHSRIFNMVGKLDRNQSASIIKQSFAVLTHDTDLMHIAAAYGKPVFSVWGSSSPAFGRFPFRPAPTSEMMQLSELSCRPCSKSGYAKCPQKHFKCMMDQDYEGLCERINFLFHSNKE